MPGPSLPLLPLLPLLVIAGNVYPQCFLKERLSVKNTLKLKGFQTPGHAVQLRIKAVLRADSPVRPWFGASAKLKVRLVTAFDIIFTFQMHLASQQQDPGFQSFGQLGSLCGEFACSLWVFLLPHTAQSHAWGWDNWGFQIGCSLVCLSVLACLACTLPFTL